MFLPIGDTPNPRGTPYVNYALVGLNVAIFVAVSLPLMMARPDLNDPYLLEYLKLLGAQGALPAEVIYQHVTAYDLFVFRYGFRPAEPSVLTLLTAMFLHGGWMHLAGNMLFLWIYGDNVEHRLGHVGYLLAYLAAGVCATIFFGLFVPDSQVPMLGASGAISGVLGLYFLWFPRNQVKVFVFFFPILMTTLLIPARLVLGVYLVLDNILPFLTTSQEGSGVAYGAHIGGFLAGLVLAYGFDHLPGRLQLRSDTPRVKKDRARLVNVVTEIIKALDRGDHAQAASLYPLLESRVQRGNLATNNLLAIGDYFLESGEPEQALTVYRRLIAERPGDVHLDRAYLGAGRALMHKARSETAAYHYFLAAIDLAQTPSVVAEARRYLTMIEGMVD